MNIEKLKITKEMRDELRKSFPKEAYSEHPTKPFLTTLKAMYVIERLNDVFGVGRWSIEHSVVERTNDYVLIQGNFISLDYDIITPSQYGGHKTSGNNTEIADGYKSAITDCISKISSYLEIGIDMFKGEIIVGNKKENKVSFKKLTQQEVTNKWNGKIYNDKYVYIDNYKYEISKEQTIKLKLLDKYIKE